MRRRTVAVLQAAFSTVLASCAQPPPAAKPAEPVAPLASADVAVPTASPAKAEPPTAPTAPAGAPTSMPPGAAPPVASRPDEGKPVFVEGSPTSRHFSQLCAGGVVPSLRPGRPVDSLEMRVRKETDQRVEIVVTGRAGSPCGTAKDTAACQRAFEAALPPANQEILVFTRGDEVGVVGRAGIPAFLAPIDSPDEAAFAAVYGPPGAETAVSCDPAEYKPSPGGFTSTQRRDSRCAHDVFTFAVSKDGKARVANRQHTEQKPCRMPVKGRRPEGLAALPATDGSLGAYLADACAGEAASVVSFRRLERELAALQAPRALRSRAKASALDEARHARTMRRLARRAGVEPSRPRVARIASRGVLAIALENAVEGCAHETWAALVARYQAEHATDDELRAAMRVIADDETRHAALAWDVRAWLEARLTPDERARVQRAYEEALASLCRGEDAALDERARRALGLPTAETSQALVERWADTARGLLAASSARRAQGDRDALLA